MTRLVLAMCLLLAPPCWGWFSSSAQAQVVAFGASNVAGRGVSPSEAFPARLEEMLNARGYSVHVVNAGVSGDGTQRMLARFDAAIPEGTRVVILDIGGGAFNNARLGFERATTVADFAIMRGKLSARRIKVVDLHSNRGMPDKFKQYDGLHLTAEGHQFLAAKLLPSVMAALGRPK